MLAQVKKLAGGDIGGRFGAWWNGRDYAPPAEAEGEGATAPDKPEAAKPEAVKAEEKPAAKPAEVPPAPQPVQPEPAAEYVDGGAVRIRALETLWGEGRLAPGSYSLDTRLVDAALEIADRPGNIGFIGGDGALLNAFVAQSDRKPVATEWRRACVARISELVPVAAITAGDVDRPRGFDEASLPAIVSVEAFAYADHKAGLVGRVFRALDSKGRWVFLDTTRRTKKTPPQAFASAWAEPQLSTNDEIEELLTLAGFKSVRRVSASDLVLAAAKQGYANLSQVLESAASSGLSGREGALFLQELAWEAQSWRARTRAIEGGALEINLWVADKTEQNRPLAMSLDHVIGADDAGAADALFDKA
jgi:hypothetical protein